MNAVKRTVQKRDIRLEDRAMKFKPQNTDRGNARYAKMVEDATQPMVNSGHQLYLKRRMLWYGR